MALNSSIEWTEVTWNPVTGCSHISAGCANCYAERMALRLQAAGMPKYRNGFEVTTHEKELLTPQGWRKPHDVFLGECGTPPTFLSDVKAQRGFAASDRTRETHSTHYVRHASRA